MKNRSFAILAAATAGLVVLALWQSQRQARRMAHPDARGAPVFPSLDVSALNRVAALTFASGTQTVRYARAGEQWVAPDRYRYPLKAERVLDFLRRLPELTRREAFGSAPATLARMDLAPTNDAGGSRAVDVTLADEGGRTVLAFRVGKERVRGEMGAPSGRYIRVDGQAVLVNDPFADLPQSASDWLDRDLINLSSMDLVAAGVRAATGTVVSLRRPAAGGDFAVENLATNETTNLDAANRLTGLPSYLAFEDLADPAALDSETGLDQPVTYEFRTAKGPIYRLAIGRGGADTNTVFARLSFAFEPPAEPETPALSAPPATNAPVAYSPEVQKQMDAEREQTEKEIQTLQARFQPWVFKLPAYRFEGLGPDRAAFVSSRAPTSAEPSAASPPAAAEGEDESPDTEMEPPAP